MHRNADCLAVILLGLREITNFEAHLAIPRLGMDWDVMQIHHDVAGAQPLEHLQMASFHLVEPQPDHIKMPS